VFGQVAVVLDDESTIAMLSGDDASAENWSRIALERVRRQFDIQTVSVSVDRCASLLLALQSRQVEDKWPPRRRRTPK
jgi:hypothetical protein